ncbi:MAG: hypothetical protein Roseis2KO_54140 [Roseivirga sp.]
MENEQHSQTSEVADMKVLSGRAHEYVVNFRNRFLTYFALPLFLLFIALALFISWLVLVPARSEYATTIMNEAGKQPVLVLSEETVSFIQLHADKIESAHLSYAADGTIRQIDCAVNESGEVLIKELPAEWKEKQEITKATLVLFTKEERFLFKLLDELAKNLKVKKPPTNGE